MPRMPHIASALFLALALALGGGAALAQDRAQSLADIRQELSVLFVQMQRLRAELNTTGAPQTGAGATGSARERLDQLEAELRRVIGQVERLEFRINEIVRDGTNRIGDLEFRLVELEGGDTSRLGQTTTLGGEAGGQPPGPILGTGGGGGGGDAGGGMALAVGERDAFERARALAEEGDHEAAAAAFRAFVDTYPVGPFTTEAHYLRGISRARLGQWREAARAYLDAFSADPDGPRAPAALVALGTSLGELGQRDEACLTLGEVGARFPGAPEGADARAAMTELRCQ